MLTPLSIHQWMHGWGWSTIVQAIKQGDHIHTGHISPKGCYMGRWMKSRALSSSTLDGVWYTTSSNHPYRCYHHSQFVNGWMYEVDLPLYKQPSKGIISILTTQHPNDIPWVDRWKLAHFLLLLWRVCDIVPWAPTIHTSVDTPVYPYVSAWMRMIYHCTINRAKGSHPYWPHNTQIMQHGWIDENWGTFILYIGWCVM